MKKSVWRVSLLLALFSTSVPAQPAAPWPGDAEVSAIETAGIFHGNLSGLSYEPGKGNGHGVLWGAGNKPGTLYRLIFNGTSWVRDTAGGWQDGRRLRYPDGSGDPDAEGVTFTASGSRGGLFVSTERDNRKNGASRNSILRFDPSASGPLLTATHEWNLTADLRKVGSNLGIEGITWVPDRFLTSKGFFDESRNRTYNPASYPNHGGGLFFVGLEANGIAYAYALDERGARFSRIAAIATGLPSVMSLHFDEDRGFLWALCDNTCQGESVVLQVNAGGRFMPTHRFERPAGMPDLNNEGFTMVPATLCRGNTRSVFWADDGETGGHSLRSGAVTCASLQPRP